MLHLHASRRALFWHVTGKGRLQKQEEAVLHFHCVAPLFETLVELLIFHLECQQGNSST